ncbi:DUF4215 domain-containing protein [Patescibacteria group bacterium]
MEDTQMPSAGVPQTPQPDANPNPASAPAPAPSSPKKGGVIMKALIGVFAIALVGFGGWYAYNSGIFGASEDNPPSLSLGGAGFQGKSVETTYGFLQYDAADVSSYQEPAGSVYQTSRAGIRFFYPKGDTTIGEIESAFKPIDGMKFLFAFYDAEVLWPGDPEGKKKGCFVTYPVGPYEHTCLGTLTTPIEKNRAFIAITDIPGVANAAPVYEYDSSLLGDAKTLSDTLILPNLKGWTLQPFAADMDLTDSKIRSVWTQTNAAEIKTKVTDVSTVDPTSEYKMMWLKLGDPTSAGTASTGGGTCGDGTKDAGEACDDGTNNSDTAVDACRTTCVAASCGDGVVDAGEVCDDGSTNSDTVADACRTTCVAASCGDGVVDAGEVCDGTDCEADCTALLTTQTCPNNIKEGTEVCDGTDLDGKDCTDYVTGSTFSEGTLGCVADCSAYDTSACAEGVPSGGEADFCGDGVKGDTEACDDGNTEDADACLNSCEVAICGDGILRTVYPAVIFDETKKGGTIRREKCDDGTNNSDTVADACRTTCVPAFCGDNVVDTGETCDDGNTVDGDGCPADCKDEVIINYLIGGVNMNYLLSTSVSYIENLATATINGKPLTLNYTRYGDLYRTRDHDYLIAQAVAAIKVTPQGDANHYIFGDININTEGAFKHPNGTTGLLTENFCAGTGAWRTVVLYEGSDGTIKEAYTMEDVNKDGTFTYVGSTENKEAVFMEPGKEYVLVILMNDINCGFGNDMTPISHTMIPSFDLVDHTNNKVTYSEDGYSNDIDTKFTEWTE